MNAIRVSVARTAGSVPREAGTQMLVKSDGIEGTIGGGALEWEAMRLARLMIAGGMREDTRTFPLGPGLGQCCGGSVTLTFEAADSLFRPLGRQLWIYGAGHVGRAIVNVLHPLAEFDITWIDTSRDRLPRDVPGEVSILVAADPVRVVSHAPDSAEHLILTYSHEMDLALCHAILQRPFSSVGLIGSATKWARFRSRLATLGHSAEQISRIACPIGDPALGKHPQAIAIGVATALLSRLDRTTKAGTG